MSIMRLAKKAVSTAVRAKSGGRPMHGSPDPRPVRHTSPKAAAAKTAVREVSRALRK